jgi:hypothetical protein
MKMHRLKRMLAALGLIIALTLGGFSAGLAQESAAPGGYFLKLPHSFPVSAASPAYDFRFDCPFTSGTWPAPAPARASENSDVQTLGAPAVGSLYAAPLRTRKVPLHLFDSILLI